MANFSTKSSIRVRNGIKGTDDAFGDRICLLSVEDETNNVSLKKTKRSLFPKTFLPTFLALRGKKQEEDDEGRITELSESRE